MATKGIFDTYLNALDANIRYPIRQALYYLSDNWRIGTAERAENAQLYRFTGLTPSVANTEFAIKHGFGSSPKQFLQVGDLSLVNSQIVPLTISRSPDGQNLYLKSSVANATFVILLEP